MKVIKFGKHSYAVGLMPKDVARIKSGRPILVDFSELGGQGEVLIFFGLPEMLTFQSQDDHETHLLQGSDDDD